MVLYSYKTGPDAYRLAIPEIIQVPARLGRKPQNYQPYIDTFVDSLDAYIRAHPYQFFNFYDMWMNSPKTETEAEKQRKDNQI